MNWPAHPTDMGGDPGLAGGSEVPDAAVAAVRGPQSGMACDCTGAESTDARAMGWASTPTKNAKQEMRISRAASRRGLLKKVKKMKPPPEACARCTCLPWEAVL